MCAAVFFAAGNNRAERENNMVRWCVRVSLVSAALAGCSTPTVPAPPSPALTAPLLGTWVSPCTAVQNADGTDGFAQTTLTLTPTTWTSSTGNFSDETCQTQLGAFAANGVWEAERASVTLPGAFEVHMHVAARTVTPSVDGYMAFLEAMSCGAKPYAVGVAQDISAAGCANLGVAPVAQCPSEYDVVFASAAGLQLGQRGAAPCSASLRPTALAPAWTKR